MSGRPATKVAVGLAMFGTRLACFGACVTLVGGVVAIGMGRHAAVVAQQVQECSPLLGQACQVLQSTLVKVHFA